MTDTPKVQILLATYNGAQFLQEQLQSIAAQTYQNWEILARDDGSTDDTLNLLKQFQSQHPGKLKILEDRLGNSGGAAANFLILLKQSNASVAAFADQDDIWMPQKLARSVERLVQMERQYGVTTPLMVHHDFALIDRDKKILCDSFDAAHGKRREINTPERMPFRGFAHGFSMTFNRALINRALPAPAHTQGHDTLFACVASDFGKIGFIPEQLAQYRRHGANSSPISSYPARVVKTLMSGDASPKTALSKLQGVFDEARNNLRRKCRLTGEYLERYGDSLPPERKERLRKFAEMEGLGVLERKALLMKYSAESVPTRILASLTL